MALLDLRQEAAETPLHPETWPTLSDADLRLARATWRGRMVNEHVSARIFAGLVPQLMAAGVSAARQTAAATMIADELRHARLCAAVLLGLGEAPVAELPPLPPVPTHDDCDPVEALLRNTLSISCLSETVAVALIQAERQEIAVPEISAILQRILADEIQHARFGWTLLEELAPGLDSATRARLGTYLQLAFAHLEAHELAHLSAGPAPSETATGYGLCDGREARALFYETVTEVIVPGLERQGLPARAAWQNRSLALAA